ncbi:unnamed protein product [Ectocarpus sp. 12 AP-2014]
MASNVFPDGNSSWGSKHLPFSPAALVGAPESTPPQVSNEGSEREAKSGRSIPPNAPGTTAAAAAVGNYRHGQHPLYLQPLNPFHPLAGAGAGLLHGKSGDDGHDVGGVGLKHPDALRMTLLEAEITNTRSHNLHLQHHVAFLQTQMRGQLGLIAVLHNKIRALEADLKSAKAATNAVGATSNTSNPTATSCGSADTCPPQPSNPVPAEELVHHRAAHPDPEKEGTAGKYALCDLRPHDGCRATAAESDRHRGSDVAAPVRAEVAQRTMAAPLTLSPQNGEDSAVESFPRVAEAKLAPSADPPAPGSSSSALAAAAVQQAVSVGSESDGSIAAAPTTPRHSLRDFWADSSSNDIDNSPPSSNTRNKRHQAAQQEPQEANLSSAVQDGKSSEPMQTAAVDTDVAPASQEGTSAPTEKSGPPAAESLTPAEPQAVSLPVLRRITKGREGAEDRSSHLMDCASCQHSLPEGDPIGRCERCPRSFCSQCLKRGLVEQDVELEALGQDCRSLLNGKQGDFSIDRCPECCSGKDNEFAPPPPGDAPMDHLLNELLRHDLSLCFREPVDIVKHPDYVESIGRNAMMDLGTMLSKLQGKRYPRRRGPGQFQEDLNRIWRNCRRFAGCDELGRPHYGNTVPGIVRCALTLEAMSDKFISSYMSDNQETAAWQESTWDFHRQRQERENAEARRKQLGHLDVDGDKEELKPLAPGGGGMRLVTAVQQTSSETDSEQKCNMQENESLAGESAGRTSAAASQQSANETVATAGCKRSASKLAAVAEERSVQHRRTRRAASISLESTATSLGGGNPPTPRVTRRPAGKMQRQQPPWSPLDKLCDLATTFQK